MLEFQLVVNHGGDKGFTAEQKSWLRHCAQCKQAL
jgi:hypothetical protein